MVAATPPDRRTTAQLRHPTPTAPYPDRDEQAATPTSWANTGKSYLNHHPSTNASSTETQAALITPQPLSFEVTPASLQPHRSNQCRERPNTEADPSKPTPASDAKTELQLNRTSKDRPEGEHTLTVTSSPQRPNIEPSPILQLHRSNQCRERPNTKANPSEPTPAPNAETELQLNRTSEDCPEGEHTLPVTPTQEPLTSTSTNNPSPKNPKFHTLHRRKHSPNTDNSKIQANPTHKHRNPSADATTSQRTSNNTIQSNSACRHRKPTAAATTSKQTDHRKPGKFPPYRNPAHTLLFCWYVYHLAQQKNTVTHKTKKSSLKICMLKNPHNQ